MDENLPSLKLIYKNNSQDMYFFPKNYAQLRDYFLCKFNKKSSEEFIFKAYQNKNTVLTFQADRILKLIRKIEILENPAIFIIDKDEEDYMEQIDKDNLKYVETNFGFEIKNLYKDYDLDKIKKELERKNKSLLHLEKRIEYLTNGANILKEMSTISLKNNLEETNKQYEEKQEELNSQLKLLKESSF